MTLTELAERAEQAGGADRELDARIAHAVAWRWGGWEEGDLKCEERDLNWFIDRVCNSHASVYRHAPAYTASLDAAMTLVPKGLLCAVTNCDPSDPLKPDLSKASALVGDPHETGKPVIAATPALALVAAALRARSHTEGDRG